MAELQHLLWHHIEIAKPGRLLLVGNDMARVVAGVSRTEASGKLLNINQNGVNVEAVAVPHPATLLSRPAQKAAAWDSLKLLKRER
jgi:uracil-DNA glycosylase